MMRAALYVRVSTEEQRKHGLSVDSQIKALKDYCDDNGMDEAGLYNDAGISARKRYVKRPELLRLIQDCKDGKIDIILFTKLDRWFRSVADYYEVQSQLDRCKVPWKAIWEDYETITSAGVFKVNIMLSVAQSEVDRTSERIKSVMEYKVSQGDYVGAAPVGYIKKNSRLIIDESKREAMEAFFKTYIRTSSGVMACKAAYAKGVKFDSNHVGRIIRNTAYSGMTKSGYRCPAIISEELQAQAVEILGRNRRKTTKSERIYLFSGLCVCKNCGNLMTANVFKRGNRESLSYRCPNRRSPYHECPPLHVSENFVEGYLLKQLEPILKDAKIEQIKLKRKTPNQDIKKRLESKLERLTELYAEGDINKEKYLAKKLEIKKELASLPALSNKPLPTLPDTWQAIYGELDRQHRKNFWLQIVDKIVFDPRDKDHPEVHLRCSD